MSSPNSKWLKLGILILFGGGLVAFLVLGGDQYLSLETVKQNRDALLAYTEAHYTMAILLSLMIYTLSTAFSIPGATVLSLTVGFLFGRWVGTGVILFAATLGATLVFLAARYLFADMARKKMNSGLAARLINGFHDDAFNYLLFLRLVPLFPFWLVNLAPAFTPITTRTYVLGTAIGILPGCFVFANLGESLGRIDSLAQLLSAETLFALGLLGLFALLPVVVKKLKKQASSNL
jgi:uncharacterized membrane protein YdjX (TVP38/TMEM64 family)